MSGLVSGATNSPPGLVGDPGVAKAWCRIEPGGTLTGDGFLDYNVVSIGDLDIGNRNIIWDVDFASIEYSLVGSINDTAVSLLFPVFADNQAVDNVIHNIYSVSGTITDEETCVVAFGDQ